MKSKFKMIAVLILALAILATGTFAWQKIIKATNEFTGNKKHVTVHDDFDQDEGLKDVYVENSGKSTMYVRVKLEEAMNLTSDTWRPGANDWVKHTHGATPEDCGHLSIHDGKPFHDYFKWTMGGQKFYMPSDGTKDVDHDTKIYNGTEPGVKQTPNAKFTTVADFLAMSAQDQQAFYGWIYDTDGYAYWSQPLKQGDVSGLLLHGVESLPTLKDLDYYYAIDVTVEVVDYRDIPMWTQGVPSVDNSGAKHQEATPDGKKVIQTIVGNAAAPGQSSISLSNYQRTVKVGATAKPPTVSILPPGTPNSPLIWTSSDDKIATVAADGVVTGVSVGTAKIKVTSPTGLFIDYSIEVVP